MVPQLVSSGLLLRIKVERPKSQSFTVRDLRSHMMIFSSFISRWTIPRPWRNCHYVSLLLLLPEMERDVSLLTEIACAIWSNTILTSYSFMPISPEVMLSNKSPSMPLIVHGLEIIVCLFARKSTTYYSMMMYILLSMSNNRLTWMIQGCHISAITSKKPERSYLHAREMIDTRLFHEEEILLPLVYARTHSYKSLSWPPFCWFLCIVPRKLVQTSQTRFFFPSRRDHG